MQRQRISRQPTASIAAGNLGAPSSIDPRYNAHSQTYAAFEDIPPREGSSCGDSSDERDVGHMGTLDEEQLNMIQDPELRLGPASDRHSDIRGGDR